MTLSNRALTRREFLEAATGTALLVSSWKELAAQTSPGSKLFWIREIPNKPFPLKLGRNHHAGVDCLLHTMGQTGLKFYRSRTRTETSGTKGMIARDDVVLIKVNCQWKYRGCTNSDLIRGLIQRILDHPDGFEGEVVLVENGQGFGSFECNTRGWAGNSYPDFSVHANANNPLHSFSYLLRSVFKDPRVSCYLLDTISSDFIHEDDHIGDGYRILEDVSYPCFTTAGGRRVELREGLWTGSGYTQKLKLLNVPVMKIHSGSEITCCLKHTYGLLSMSDGQSDRRHYSYLGETCGKMIGCVRPPVLNIVDAIWVSPGSLKGYPPNATFRANQILAGQDPVACDYWSAKYILYPIRSSPNHHPDYPGIDRWLTEARDVINARGNLNRPSQGLFVRRVTKTEAEMKTCSRSAKEYVRQYRP